MKEPKKILVIRLSSIGDIVLTTPIIRCLKNKYPDCQIDFILKTQYKSVLEANPYIDNLLLFNEMTAAKELVNNNTYDYIIDLHNNLRTFQIKKAAKKAISFSFPKANIEKWLMVNFKVDYLPKKHIVDRYFEATKPLQIINDNKGLDFFIKEENNYELKALKADSNYIAIAVGAGHFTKQIPIEKLQFLIENIQKSIVLLGDKNDMAIAKILKLGSKNNLFDLCGQLNIQQSASVIDKSIGLLSGDTGLMHIASALKKPIFSVWGNTIPQFGMYPYLPNNNQLSSIYEVKNLKCRPCSKIGYKTCPKQHFKCMTKINYEAILGDINGLA